MNKFRNEKFNKLYEFMKRMDSSDDYLMIQVSVLNQGKDDMSTITLGTGRMDGKPVIDKAVAETVLIMAMKESDDLKRLLTDAVLHCEQFEELQRRAKS